MSNVVDMIAFYEVSTMFWYAMTARDELDEKFSFYTTMGRGRRGIAWLDYIRMPNCTNMEIS